MTFLIGFFVVLLTIIVSAGVGHHFFLHSKEVDMTVNLTDKILMGFFTILVAITLVLGIGGLMYYLGDMIRGIYNK